MKKSIRTKLLSAFLFFICVITLCLGFGMSNLYSVNATAPETFEMCKGAFVKNGSTKLDSGMQFMVKVTEGTELADDIRFVIAPLNYVNKHEFNTDNLFGANAKYYFDGDDEPVGTLKDGKVKIWNVKGVLDTISSDADNSYDYYRAAIIDFGQDSEGMTDDKYTKELVREYVAGAYIDDKTNTPQMATYPEGGQTEYARSMAYVADKALDNSETVMNGFAGVYLTNGVKDYPFKITYKYNYCGDVSDTPNTGTYIEGLAPTYTWNDGAKITMNTNDEGGYKWKGAWSDVDGTYYDSGVNGGNIGNQTLELVFHPSNTPSTTIGSYNGTFDGTTYNNTTFKIPYKGISKISIYDNPNVDDDNGAGITWDKEKNDTITVSKAGKTTFLVEFIGLPAGRNAPFTLNAERPTLAVEDEIELFDATEGKYITVDGDIVKENDIQSLLQTKTDDEINLSSTTITAESVEAESVSTTTGISYTADDKLQGIPVKIPENSNSVVKQKVNFATDTAIYQVTVCPATNVITEFSQMTSLFKPTEASTASGYYILAKDINGSTATAGGQEKNKFSGTFDGNGKTIDEANCVFYGLFGIVSGTIKNVAFTNVKLDGVTNWVRTLLGMLENTSSLENIYIKLSGSKPTTPSASGVRPASVLSNKNISYKVKMNNVVVDSSEFKLAIGGVDKTYTYYSPYGGYTRDTTDANYLWTKNETSYKVNETTLSTLQNNQRNVYFITGDYLYQYKGTADNTASTDVRILDAGNRKNDTKFNSEYVGGVSKEKAVIAYVNTFYRYDTADDMKKATKAGSANDYKAFTDTGLWTWSNVNGLTWKNTITLDKTEATINIDETVSIDAKCDVLENTDLVYSVEDESIATVDNEGVITGVKPGETIVSITDGISTFTFRIIVDAGELTPSLKFDNAINVTETRSKNDELDLKAKVIFNEKEYTDATITYSSSDTSVAEINDEGILTAKDVGVAKITVRADWRGFEITKEIELTVKNAFTLSININSEPVSEIEIYTVATSYGGNTYSNEQTIDVTAVLNGEVSDYILTSLDKDVFIIEDNKIVAVSAGVAKLKLAFKDDESIYKEFDVSVIKPVFEHDDSIKMFDATKGIGESSISEMFENAKLDGATATATSTKDQTQTGLTFTAGNGANLENLQGVPVNGKEKIDQQITLETDKIIYKITVTPYTNVINSVEEFHSIFTGGSATSRKDNDGYYILGQNISHSYKGIKHTSTGSDYHDTLSGTFDGNGYTVQGLYCQNGGLFGNVTGTIKNVKFEIGIDGFSSAQYMTLGKFTSTTVLENIYLGVKSKPKHAAEDINIFLGNGGVSVKMNNVVVDTTGLQFNRNTNDELKDTTLDRIPWGRVNLYYTFDIRASHNSAAKNLEKLKANQTNVYFITEQYLGKITTGGSYTDKYTIFEAGNRKTNWVYDSKYTVSTTSSDKWATISTVDGIPVDNIHETIYIDTFYRYDTADAMKDKTKTGSANDYKAFTDTGFWSWDETNGLVWNGKASA